MAIGSAKKEIGSSHVIDYHSSLERKKAQSN